MTFKPAARRNSKLRLALSGISGSGKTYTMLMIAKAFSANPAVGDSERGSAEKYAHKAGTAEGPGNWKFSHANIETKNPDGYLKLIREAAEQGFTVLGLDSYSHSWIGALEDVDKASGASKFTSGWKTVSPKVTKLVDRILDFPGHVIATMRSKSDFVLEKDEKTGKSTPKKVGMATVAREGTDYEFDVMLDLDPSGTMTVTKSRCAAIKVGHVYDRDEDVPKVVEALKNWLDEGAPITPLELVLERIRFADSVPALQALAPEIKALSPEDRALVKGPYESRKRELMQAQVDADDLAGIE